MKFISWVLIALADSAFAAPALARTVERRGEVPAAWTRLVAAPSPDERFTLRIGLKQANLHLLEEELLAVSDPKSVAYGQHWSPTQLARFFAPTKKSVSIVQDWLKKAGLGTEQMSASPGGNWIQGVVTVAEAEALLNAKYDRFQHSGKSHALGCDSYSIPSDVHEHIDVVYPTTHFFQPRANARISKASKPMAAIPAALAPQNSTASCTALTTLACLRELYNFNGYVQKATSQNSLGIAEYSPERYVQSDFDIFAAKYIPSIVGQKPYLASIDGGNVDPGQAGASSGESNLDFQYACGLAPGVPTTLYQTTGNTVLVENYDRWLDALDSSYCNSTLDGDVDCGTVKTTNVISTSYGDDEGVYNHAMARRECAEFGKLGLLGVTLLYSSGDNGADCKIDGSPYNPSFPASCPFVTAVGATETVAAVLGGYSEIASAAFPSGGGFSNIFTLPSYQADAVRNYMSKFAPSDSGYNNSGNARAYPDIAANGVNFDVIVNGQSSPEDGTSASAPVVAAIIALANDARIAAGKGPVGFINPSLYSTAFKGAFNDITIGENAPSGCVAEGYTAQVGWDPVTGLGTPDFSKLLPLFLALP